MNAFMQAAWDEAKAGLDDGNLPVGSVIVKDGTVIGRGRNRQRENGDPTSHAELEASGDGARRQAAEDPAKLFEGVTCYTTMMPRPMCAGALIRFGFADVVVAETESYADAGTQPLMERQGLEVDVTNEQSCIDLVHSYDEKEPPAAQAMRSGARAKLKL